MPGVLKYWNGSAWVEVDVPGPVGPTGPTGSTGDTGPTGAGVATGGSTGDVLNKASSTNFDTAWVTRTNLAADSAFTSAFASKVPSIGTGLGTSGTVNLDMASLNDTYQTISLAGAITFTTSNRAGGRTVTIRLVAGASSRTLAWPSWVFVGSAAPTSLAANKTAVVTVTFFGTADTDGVAAYAAQP